jgi:hypothetical protein
VTDAAGNAQRSRSRAAQRGALILRRIDLRATRQFDPRLGSLRFVAELTNATNRDNPCCLAFDPVTSADGSLALERSERNSLPLIVNLGLLWEF